MDDSVSSLTTLLADRNGAYIYLALSVATLYDHLITLDLEVDFIWRRPKFSIAQTLFIINRYLGDVVLTYAAIVLIMQSSPSTFQKGLVVSSSQCQMLGSLQTWAGAVITWTMQGIMVIRINAMYRGTPTVKALQLVFFLVEILSMTTMQAIVPRQLIGLTCSVRRYPWWYQWLWGPILAFEGLTMGLAIWAGYEHYRDYSRKAPILFSSEGKSLAYVMMRDSILFPFVAVVMCVINFIGWNHLSYAAAQANTGVMIFAPRILGCRLVLNLREIYYRPFGDEYSRDYARTILPIKFVQDSNDIVTLGSKV
ncbi:hypothetical protein BDZ97DRAFT_2076573 [Flammula alnicola]|nr:hypothetical protein BDZ97DRAFT_2076573 [Flammula alnicola]